MIGLLWEMYNFEARAKWIYTVPFFENLKLFEMPVLGFFGFPPFAVECFTLWQALVLGGLAVPRWGKMHPAPAGNRAGALLAAVAFSALVLFGMESRTFSSYTPRLARLPDVPATTLESAGYDVFTLATASPHDVVERMNVDPGVAADWVEMARLAALRGIGVRNARLLQEAGISCIAALAGANDRELADRLQGLTGQPVVIARVRVWIRAAARLLQESTTNTALEGSTTCVSA
jgi:predicted flap endonuclease-1-like 5' DNA nuclease